MIADALNLLALTPRGLGGLWLRARSSPLRDKVLEGVHARFPGARRITPATDEAALFGALDVVATLATGREIQQAGLVHPDAVLILTMAERASPALCARLGAALEAGELRAIIALDEGDGEEALHPALADRLGLCVELDGLRDVALPVVGAAGGEPQASDLDRERLVVLAAQLGVRGARAPLFALNAARGLARLEGRDAIAESDLIGAAQLVLAPRATQLPQEGEDTSPPPPPPDSEAQKGQSQELDLPEDLLLEAVRASLPADVLAGLTAKAQRVAQGAGAGSRKQGNRRGRPLPARPGRPGHGARLDLVATLRAAAPWQTIRRQTQHDGPPVLIRPTDLRLRRFEERSDRVLIFGIDASGSTAMARLAEAKGAIELLLAEAYARRDHVALVAFRGEEADVLLPPTRALVAAKRGLTGLAGGGGTPLASGLREMAALALTAAGRGQSPALVLLTDGKGNIALDRSTSRTAARADVEAMARQVAAQGWPTLLIDTANRPQSGAKQLSQALRGTYLALPRADARAMSQAVDAALSAP